MQAGHGSRALVSNACAGPTLHAQARARLRTRSDSRAASASAAPSRACRRARSATSAGAAGATAPARSASAASSSNMRFCCSRQSCLRSRHVPCSGWRRALPRRAALHFKLLYACDGLYKEVNPSRLFVAT